MFAGQTIVQGPDTDAQAENSEVLPLVSVTDPPSMMMGVWLLRPLMVTSVAPESI